MPPSLTLFEIAHCTLHIPHSQPHPQPHPHPAMTDLCSQAKDSRAGNDILVAIDTALHPPAAAQLPTDEELAVSLGPIQSLPMTDSVASANSLSHVNSTWKDAEENLPDHDWAHRDPWAKVLAGTPGSFPLSLIPPMTTNLTPEMLPLINLTQTDIDRIVEQTPGKVSNIQDIYPLLPLQDTLLPSSPGVKADSYLLSSHIVFENKDLLDRYLQASQKVVDRHDILRTAFVWKDISTPAQVVWRHATIPTQELVLDPANGPVIKQLEERFHPNYYRINLTQAPLMQCAIAQETDGRWMLLQLTHQLIGDRVVSEMMNLEIEQILHGQESSLPIPWTSHNLFMQISEAATHKGHEKFFKAMLGDVENPTFPFGLSNTHTIGEDITESSLALPQDLKDRLRFHAKHVGVTLASLYHVAWAQVVARTSEQDDVVFGTVLSGGQEWNNAMGPSINTVPFRCDTDTRVRECIQRTHVQLEALLYNTEKWKMTSNSQKR
ncbi:condensation domain-containing protein [Mortierella sp. GBAus27b]|nr:condensation domain-containing protein [Mortierella sp. GBAus27b]